MLRSGRTVNVTGSYSSRDAKARSLASTEKAPKPKLLFDVAVPKRAEALALRTVLARAFRSSPSSRGKARGAKKKSAPRAPTGPVVTADSSRAEAKSSTPAGGELSVSWQVTPAQAGTIAVWFRRLGLRSSAPAGRAEPAIRIAGESRVRTPHDGAKSAPAKSEGTRREWADQAIPVSVRIRFGPQPKEPERPRSEDR